MPMVIKTETRTAFPKIKKIFTQKSGKNNT